MGKVNFKRTLKNVPHLKGKENFWAANISSKDENKTRNAQRNIIRFTKLSLSNIKTMEHDCI